MIADGDTSRASADKVEGSQPAASRAKRGIRTACSSRATVSRGNRPLISSTTASLKTLDILVGTAITTWAVASISGKGDAIVQKEMVFAKLETCGLGT